MSQCAELSENEKDLRKSMQTELTALKVSTSIMPPTVIIITLHHTVLLGGTE